MGGGASKFSDRVEGASTDELAAFMSSLSSENQQKLHEACAKAKANQAKQTEPQVIKRESGALPRIVKEIKAMHACPVPLGTTAAKGEGGIKWVIMNGFSQYQDDYCKWIFDEWKKTFEGRGDSVVQSLSSDKGFSKAQITEALKALFAGGGACGIFIVCHGEVDSGKWCGFNANARSESFDWSDIEAC
eukprot:TRINITY_DN112800_c0_g1_i1.p1 TRINITY_DN112800_c0_g1~~TRINITY_DN112800_c0_g1_i1.p1  ORF type:complete len:189 (+),score=31.13 TRINITY_DN112800_c0_g1_i1:51-617(+)